MASKTSVGKGTLYNFISGMVNVLGGYLTAVIAARILGPETFGMYSIVTSVVFLISAVLMTGVQQTTARFVAEKPTRAKAIKNQIFKIQAFVATGFFILYFLLSPVISYMFNDLSLVPYIRYCSLIIVFQSLFSVYAGYLNGLRNFKGQAILISFYSVLKAVLVIGLVILGYSITGAITGFVAATLISLVVALIAFGFKRDKDVLPNGKIIKFGVSIFVFNVVTVLLMNIDLFFVKSFSPQLSANILSGYYNAALQISRAPYYIISALTLTIFPVIAELHHNGHRDKISQQLEKSISYSVMIMTYIVSVIATTAGALISLFYGQNYATSAMILAVIIFSGAFFALVLLLLTIIAAIGEANKAVAIGGTGLIISAIMIFFLVTRYSFMGAAWAITISMLVLLIICAAYIRKKLDMKFETRKISLTLIAGAIIFATSILTPISGFLLLAKYIGLAIEFMAILYLTRALTREDVKFFLRIIMPTKV